METGAHLGGLFGCHDRPLFASQVLSIKADKNQTLLLQVSRCFGTGNSLHFPSNVA